VRFTSHLYIMKLSYLLTTFSWTIRLWTS